MDRSGSRWQRLLGSIVLLVVVAAGCGGGGSSGAKASSSSSSSSSSSAKKSASSGASTTSSASDHSDSSALPAGATKGLDDYDGDGEPEPTCGTQDFGGGLVLRILCDIGGRNSEPPEGVTLTPDSLFRLPTDSTVDLTDISGSAVYARDDAGNRVYVIVFNSDALFETGSDVISAPDTFANLVALINRSFSGSQIQVRGHTDSTGSPAANQSLSEGRAASVASYLTGQGVKASGVTSIGFGQTQPLAIEDNDAARQFNRRVEVVIRLTG